MDLRQYNFEKQAFPIIHENDFVHFYSRYGMHFENSKEFAYLPLKKEQAKKLIENLKDQYFGHFLLRR
jgi:hypothetical protein